MKRSIITTADGSKTIYIEDWGETYHSIHGAIREAYHVFIDRGLSACSTLNPDILEIGFGTGLNALITLLEAHRTGRQIRYTGWEAFPVPMDELLQLRYADALHAPLFREYFEKMHTCPWNEPQPIREGFSLLKRQADFRTINEYNSFDLIYFDAFGAQIQPELWTGAIFEKMYRALRKGGTLVTYAAKGSVRRAMLAAGFAVERLPGPPGKREMLRAVKEGIL